MVNVHPKITLGPQDRRIPLEEMITEFNQSLSDGDAQRHREVVDELVQRFLPKVTRKAAKISMYTKVEFSDLVQEGMLTLCEYFNRSSAIPEHFSNKITGWVQQRLARYTEDEIGQKLHPILSQYAIHALYTDGKHNAIAELETNRFLEIIRNILSKEEFDLFEQYSDPNMDPKWATKMSEKHNVCRQLIYVRGEKLRKKLWSALAKNFYEVEHIALPDFTATLTEASHHPTAVKINNYYGDAFSDDRDYSGQSSIRNFQFPYIYDDLGFRLPLLDVIDDALQESQGISLGEVVVGLSYNEKDFGKFVMRCLNDMDLQDMEPYLTRERREDWIMASLHVEYKRLVSEGKSLVAHPAIEYGKQITERLGMTPYAFMTYFQITQNDFVQYVKSLFPDISDEDLKKVMSLKPDEMHHEKSQGTLEHRMIDAVLPKLVDAEFRKHFPGMVRKLPDVLKHAYFPVFLEDPEHCFELLEHQIHHYEGTTLQGALQSAYGFFQGAERLSIPKIKTELDLFQRVDVLTLAEKKRMILASETGIGKSLEIIATAEYVRAKKILVISSKSSLESTWGNEISKHTGDKAVVISGDTTNKSIVLQQAAQSRWVICNYETYRNMHEAFLALQPQMIVVDEADIMNNPNSQRTRAIAVSSAEYQYCVSGWIFKNRRSELWPILHWLNPHEYSSFKKFRQDFVSDEEGKMRLKFRLNSSLIYRHKSHVLPDLPPILHETRYVQMDEMQGETYSDVEQSFIQWYHEQKGERPPFPIVLSKMHELRQAALQPKFELLYQELEECSAEQQKAVVFSSYLQAAAKVREELSHRFGVEYFDGGTSAAEREERIQRFNSDPRVSVMVMTEAGGKSIDLTAANRLYILTPVWTYSAKKQLMDRLHRRGQQLPVHIVELVTAGTIEEAMVERIEQKRQEYEETVLDRYGYLTWFQDREDQMLDYLLKDLLRNQQTPYKP